MLQPTKEDPVEPNIELLAPAGSAQSLRAAVNAGADAVYMGSTRFGARAYADNPDEDSFLEAMDYAHMHGRKVYLTVNTLLKERETGDLYAYLKPFYERGIDAVIVQDYGALLLIRKWFPDLPVHASTQMTVTGRRIAMELKDAGVSRIILARELSLAEIKDIAGSVDIELECFVHGALCYCYSGQCLMSSLIGGRSGNRGRCAQPCRLPYSADTASDSYLLNMKDLETLKILPDILDAGVSALKIEGRMKSPRYTAGVVSIYRRYLDLLKKEGRDGYKVLESDILALSDLFDRGGYTDGYFSRHNGRDMISLTEKPDFRKTDQEHFSALDSEYVNSVMKIPVRGSIRIHEGEPVSLTVCDIPKEDIKVTVQGPDAAPARTQPLTAEQVVRQIKKTGNSICEFEELDCDIAGSCFMAVKELNELRRQGLRAFSDRCLESYRREPVRDISDSARIITPDDENGKVRMGNVTQGPFPQKPAFNVSVEDICDLETVLSFDCVDEIYIDSACTDAGYWIKAAHSIHDAGRKCALILPRIFRKEAEDYFNVHLRELAGAGFDEFIICSLEEPGFLREKGLDIPLVFDSNIYTWNRAAQEGYTAMGASRITLPAELNSHELMDLGCSDKELIVYGHLPVMVTAQCVRRTVSGCDRQPGCLLMKDRTGRDFPVKNICRFCYNIIYNTVPLTLIGEEKTVQRLCPASLRLMFTVESPSQIKEILKACEDSFLLGKKTDIPFREYTRGHFNRGVE